MKLLEKLAKIGLYVPTQTEICESLFGPRELSLKQSIYEGIAWIRVEELRKMNVPYTVYHKIPFIGEPYTSKIVIKHPDLKDKSSDEIIENPKLFYLARKSYAAINIKDRLAREIVKEIMKKRFSEYYQLRKMGFSATDALRKMGYEEKIRSDLRRRVEKKLKEFDSLEVDTETYVSELAKWYREIESLSIWKVLFGKSPEIEEI